MPITTTRIDIYVNVDSVTHFNNFDKQTYDIKSKVCHKIFVLPSQ